MFADLIIIIFVMYVYEFDMISYTFFLVAINLIIMKFIFLTFLFVFRSAVLATQLLCISWSFFYIFEALCK